MNLVQKLPIGLGLACMMMLSSCSKEDVKTPEPQVAGMNESSGLRGGLSTDPNDPSGGWNALPKISPTTGATGLGVYAPGWSKSYYSLPASPQLLPSGTSNFTRLWGAPNLPWLTSLPSHPAIPNTARFLTIAADEDGDWANAAIAETKIQYLKPGKKYSITYYAITSIANASEAHPRVLAVILSKCISNLWQEGDGCTVNGSNGFSLNENEQGIWIKKVIEFDAPGTEMTMNFVANTSVAGKTGYFNIYIDKNSIKQLN